MIRFVNLVSLLIVGCWLTMQTTHAGDKGLYKIPKITIGKDYYWKNQGPVWYMPALRCGSHYHTRKPWKYICCEDRLHPRQKYDSCCGKKPYRTCTHICCGGRVHLRSSPFLKCCHKNERRQRLYDSKTHLCCKGNVFRKKSTFDRCCGRHKFYNHLKQICCGKRVKERIYGSKTRCCKKLLFKRTDSRRCCRGKLYNPNEKGCCRNRDKKTARLYPKTVRYLCCKGVVHHYMGTLTGSQVPSWSCCGRRWYNHNTHVCCGGRLIYIKKTGHVCCGSTYQRTQGPPGSFICCQDILHGKRYGKNTRCCQQMPYNRKTHICCGCHIYRRKSKHYACCGNYYGLLPYNTKTHYCCCNQVKRKPRVRPPWWKCCVSEVYNGNTHICCNGRVQPRFPHGHSRACCGKFTYSTKTHVCCGMAVYPKSSSHKCCGGLFRYNVFNEKCVSGAIEQKGGR